MTFTGTLNNTGQTLTLNGAGLVLLRGGLITGGVIAGAAGAILRVPDGFNGTLDGVTLGMDVAVDSSASLTVKNGLTMNNAKVTLNSTFNQFAVFPAYIYFDGTQTITGTGEIVFGGNAQGRFYARGDGTQVGAAVLTIGTQIIVRGVQSGIIEALSSFDRVINQGTIVAVVPNRTIALNNVTNQGSIAAEAGTVTWSNPQPNTGTIRSGAGGLVAISGSFTISSNGAGSIDIGGTAASQFGRLTVTSPATLDGTLNLPLVNGFSPAIGNSFQVMTFGSLTGQFATINGTALGNGKQFSPAYSATNLTLNVTAAAPIPAMLDSDGDGIPDAQELLAGTDPLDAASKLQMDATRLQCRTAIRQRRGPHLRGGMLHRLEGRRVVHHSQQHSRHRRTHTIHRRNRCHPRPKVLLPTAGVAAIRSRGEFHFVLHVARV